MRTDHVTPGDYDDLLAALRLCADRLSVVIESDNEDHDGASADDVAAYSAALAAIDKAEAKATDADH